jgi:Na+-transporting NADH:ubiquinone oxidoreductase subunit NqrB
MNYKDPRHYQISVLALLLAYGTFVLDFSIEFQNVLAISISALVTQYLFSVGSSLKFEPRSALISILSLCLFLRTNDINLACLAGFLAIASKFVLRYNGKHIFNPTNFSIVILLLLADSVWISPGQWGSVAYLAMLIACFGSLVVFRAKRSDVTYAFIFFYVAIVFGRAIWLGDPLTIPLHQIQNGTLIIFSFFMISDPMTTPNSRLGRIIFALLVAVVGAYIQFWRYEPNGVLYALIICSCLVPFIDRLLLAERYAWDRPTTGEKRRSHILRQAPSIQH